MSELGNLFSVGARRERIMVMSLARRFPTVDLGPLDMSKDEALNLAAYLRLIADPTGEEFDRLLNQITEI